MMFANFSIDATASYGELKLAQLRGLNTIMYTHAFLITYIGRDTLQNVKFSKQS